MPIWGPGAVLEGERGGRVSSQSRCGVGGWASLGVRALAKAGRGWSGRGSSGGQSSVIHAFCFGALSKSTRREVNWHNDVTKAHRALNARDASAASGSVIVDRHGWHLLIAWLALQNISSIRSGSGICPRFGIVRRTVPNFPAHLKTTWLPG